MVCKQTESSLLSATLPLQIQFVYTLFGQFVYTPSIWVLYTPFVYTLFDQFVYTPLDLGTLHTFCLHKFDSKRVCKQTESPLLSATLPLQKLTKLAQNGCVNKLNPPC